MKITISNLKIYAHHGVLPEEETLGGRFALDLELEYDAGAAVDSDDLHHAVDYGRITSVVEKIVRNQRYRLIESLAAHIVQDLLAMFMRVDTVTVRLRKLHTPLEQMPDFVQVEHSATRSRI